MPGRSIAAFFCTACVGPLLGFCGILAYMLWKSPPRADHLDDLWELLLAAYYVGGGPAIIAGLIMAWLVRRRSWIGLRAWSVVTALFTFAPPVLALALAIALGGWRSPEIILIEIIVPMWISAILFASVGLRALLIAGQVLLPPARDDGLTHPVAEDEDRAGA